MAVAASANLSAITQAARVMFQKTPSATELSALAAQVDQGRQSLPQAIADLANAAQRGTGNADELTRLFFILFGRAPDYATFTAAMDMMDTGGYSLRDICQIGLSHSMSQLKNDTSVSNSQFIAGLAARMFKDEKAPLALTTAIADITRWLNAGLMTRSQVLEIAAGYDGIDLKYHDYTNTALMYLAALGRSASSSELAAGVGKSDLVLARSVMTDAGAAPYGTLPYAVVDTANLSLSGVVATDFSIDLNAGTSKLGTNSAYSLFYSTDGGATESSLRYSKDLFANVSNVDASALTGPTKTFSATARATGSTLIAPPDAVTSTLTGGAGNDRLVGGSGKDILNGGGGRDTLLGGAGDDALYAGAGGVVDMTGDLGNDTFYFPAANSLRSKGGEIDIHDFGNGTDVIQLATLFGNNKPAAAKLIVGTSDRSKGFVPINTVVNNSVILVANSGNWVDTAGTGDVTVDLTPRTSAQVAALFTELYTPVGSNAQSVRPVTFTTAPTVASTYVVFTYDPIHGADVWMVSNLSELSRVTESEVQLIGHVDVSSLTDTWTALQVSGAILA